MSINRYKSNFHLYPKTDEHKFIHIYDICKQYVRQKTNWIDIEDRTSIQTL